MEVECLVALEPIAISTVAARSCILVAVVVECPVLVLLEALKVVVEDARMC